MTILMWVIWGIFLIAVIGQFVAVLLTAGAFLCYAVTRIIEAKRHELGKHTPFHS